MSAFKGLISSIYPTLCKSCKVPLVKGEEAYCLHCELNFMDIGTAFEKQEELAQLFWGKATIKNVFVPYQFLKKEKLQTLIHEFKYNGNKKLALNLGAHMAKVLKLDLIPDSAVTFVPMHPKKQRKRGYNQAEILAKGFADYHGFELKSLILRPEETATQTDKGVYDRFENMAQRFRVRELNKLKHVYLIDDVITTGATLVSCANELITNGVEVTIVCLAYRGLED